MKRNFMKKVLVAVSVLSLGLVVSQGKASASKLPNDYLGTWYGYIGTKKVHHQRQYLFNRIKVSENKMVDAYCVSAHADGTHLKWQYEGSSLATFQSRTKHNGRVVYDINTPVDPGDGPIGSMWLQTLESDGKSYESLAIDNTGDRVYVFRNPIQVRPWGMDMEDDLALLS